MILQQNGASNRDQVYGGNNSKSDPDDNREQYGAQGSILKDLLQHQVMW
jgi:hypothetical protein